MAHAIVERKYMTMMLPRSGNVGALPAPNGVVTTADLTALAVGDPYVFFQADGCDLYVMSGPTLGIAQAINPGSAGLAGSLASTGGSTPAYAGPTGACGLLLQSLPPQRFILEPGQDLFLGFTPRSGFGWLRWWRASMVSNG